MKKNILTLLFGAVFMVLSLLNVQHVVSIDYDVVNYGFPLPWLYFYVAGIMPVNLWFPSLIGITADSLFWFAISFVAVIILSKLGKATRIR